jgi:hypothetical protein
VRRARVKLRRKSSKPNVKTRLLGTKQKALRYIKQQIIKGLQVFFSKGFFLYIDSEILSYKLRLYSLIGVRKKEINKKLVNYIKLVDYIKFVNYIKLIDLIGYKLYKNTYVIFTL